MYEKPSRLSDLRFCSALAAIATPFMPSLLLFRLRSVRVRLVEKDSQTLCHAEW